MRKYAIIIGIVLGVLCIFLLVGVYWAVREYYKPQAPTLSLVTSTATKPQPTVVSPANPTSTETSSPTETVTPTAEPLVCGQSGSWMILFLGRTIHLDPAPAQMIRLVKVDFDHQTTSIYSLPPDLVIETPGLTQEYKIQTSRLQDIFTALVIANGENRDTSYKATQATAQAILDNFGIAPDHYITIKEDFVMEITDTLGGIDVVLPQDFTMPEPSKYRGIFLEAGSHHFDGEMLHAYTTYREDTADEFTRLAHQNVVLEGLRKKMLDPAAYIKIPELYAVYKEHIVTDLSLEQIAALSCLTRLIRPENIVTVTPTMDQITINQDGSMYMKNPANLVKQIQTLFEVP